MTNNPASSGAPSMDDTILATLKAINQRNRQLYLAAAARTSGQPDYSIDRSSDGESDDASDDNDGSDAMISQTGSQNPLLNSPQLSPQYAPQLLAGVDGNAAFNPSPQDWVQALGDYTGQPPQDDGTSPAADASAQDWAQALGAYAGLPPGDDAGTQSGASPQELAQALEEYPQFPDDTPPRRIVAPNLDQIASAGANIDPQKWIPADPDRTKKFICDGLKNGGYIERDDPSHNDDLSWRDAEHALFAYTTTRDNPAFFLPAHFWGDPAYSALKALGGKLGILDPDTSPGSVEEALAGINGAFRGMDTAVGKDNPFQCP